MVGIESTSIGSLSINRQIVLDVQVQQKIRTPKEKPQNELGSPLIVENLISFMMKSDTA